MLSKPGIFDAPPASAASVPQSDYIQPTLGHGLRVWWAYYWPTTLISAFVGTFVSFVLKFVYDSTNVPGRWLFWVRQTQDYLVTAAVAFFVIDYILQKQFRHFRIALLPTSAGKGTQEVRVNLRRSSRVWWTFTWRNFIGGMLAWVVVILPLQWFLGLFRPGEIFATIFFVLTGFIVGGGVALFVIYSSILDEDFGEFRVCLMPRKAAEPAASSVTPAAPSPLPQ